MNYLLFYCLARWKCCITESNPKTVQQIIWSIFCRDKFSKVDDVYRHYGMLHVKKLFKFHVACFVYKTCQYQLPLCFEHFFLKLGLAMLDLVKLDNSTTYICPSTKNLFANKLSNLLKLKFGMIYP